MMNGKTILIVEDDVDLCNSMLTTLDRAGYSPTAATELREALFRLKNQTYSCILLDIRLGTDSGTDVISFVRDRKDSVNSSTPIIVVSGHLDRLVVAKIARDIQGALVKPFDMKSLIESIKKVTEGKK